MRDFDTVIRGNIVRTDQVIEALRVGSNADIAIFEPGEHVVDPSTSQTVVTWSPYEGMTLPGRVAATFVRGKMVWDGSNVIAEQGYGTFIKPYGRT